MYYLIDVANFARKTGSKDKKKRKKKSLTGILVKPVLVGAGLGGTAGAIASVSNERKVVKRIQQETNVMKQAFLKTLDKDSMQVYGDTLFELKKAGVDQRTASIYADQAKQDFIKGQNGMFETPAKGRINEGNIMRGIKRGAGAGAKIGLGLGILGVGLKVYGDKKRKEYFENKKKNKNSPK